MSIVSQAITGRISHDIAKARIACQTAASTVITCENCGNVLDEKRTAVVQFLSRQDNATRCTVALCTDCLHKQYDYFLKKIPHATCETWRYAGDIEHYQVPKPIGVPITLRTSDKEGLQIVGQYVPKTDKRFCVERIELRRWRLSHIPTGGRVADFTTKKRANEVGQHCHALLVGESRLLCTDPRTVANILRSYILGLTDRK